MLTEEMDGCAQDYRQADNHPIAAMGTEPYDVPPSYALPDRMREYCAFLSQPDVHPLIKSAVAQAYILVARPFPEGNERLSRMMSSAVLLRCGYDFFRDISLSAVIAKESYRYYKAMKEILRPESGGDLTYFMEYFLELLVRAVDARKERLRRREQEALEKERQLAVQPLQAEAPPDAAPTPVENDEKTKVNPTNASDDRLVTGDHLPMDTYIGLVDRLKHSQSERVRQIPQTVRSMIKAGILTFTIRQWSEYSGLPNEASDQQCRIMFNKELLDKTMTYTFRIIPTSPDGSPKHENTDTNSQAVTPAGGLPIPEGLESKLRVMEKSSFETHHHAAQAIRHLLAQGICTFRKTDWPALTGLSKDLADNTCETMANLQMIQNISKKGARAVYVINMGNAKEPVSPEVILKLNSMKDDDKSDRDRRIGMFLLSVIGSGKRTFSSLDWESAYQQSSTVFGADIRRALNLGLIRKDEGNTSGLKWTYTICSKLEPGIRAEDMTQTQKEYVARLYDAFGKKEFTIEESAKALGCKGVSASFHIGNFSERGILEAHQHPGRAYTYSFTATPEHNPECFGTVHKGAASGTNSSMAAAGAQRCAAVAV